MDLFSVNIHLRIITSSDEGTMLVLLDENGDIPKISLSKNSTIESEILNKLRDLLYQNDIHVVWQTKQISCIYNSGESLDIFYMLFSTSDIAKKGSFVQFNKNSIELYRLMNNNVHQ